MIYFTTFILTLLFAHIARAVPGCGDDAYPEEVYDPTYDDYDPTYEPTYEPTYDSTYDDGQEAFPAVQHVKVTWSPKYGNPNGNTLTSVSCSNGPHGLAPKYPHFKDFPHFPFIGGKFHVKWGSPNCGGCWKLIHKKTGDHIHVTVIDHAPPDTFDISKHAYKVLNGGSAFPGTIHAEAHHVSKHPCK
jgi:cerato-platanin